MSAYEELVERILSNGKLYASRREYVEDILAEVRRTLETVTAEMSEAGDCAFENGYVREVYSAMLRASPLEPAK
jgi:hypothetical protein